MTKGIKRLESPLRAATEESPLASGTTSLAVGGVGVACNLLCYASLYCLVTTGEGLPPGPGGLLGAAEGISYLVVLALIGYSAYTKATTGSGLPAGEASLVGAAEGLSYLTLLGAFGGFGYTFITKGGIPGPLG